MGLIGAIVNTALGKSRIEKIIAGVSKHIFNSYYDDKNAFYSEICDMGLKHKIINNRSVYFYDAIHSDYIGDMKRNSRISKDLDLCVQSIYVHFYFNEKDEKDIESILIHFNHPEQYKYMPEYIKQKLSDLKNRYDEAINPNSNFIRKASTYPRIGFRENGLFISYKDQNETDRLKQEIIKKEKEKRLFIDKYFDEIVEIIREIIDISFIDNDGQTDYNMKNINSYILTAVKHESFMEQNVRENMKQDMIYNFEYYEKLVKENEDEK